MKESDWCPLNTRRQKLLGAHIIIVIIIIIDT